MPFAVRTLTLGVPCVAAVVGVIAVVQPVVAVILALALAWGVLMLADLRIGVCVFAFSSVLLDGVAAGSISADKVVAGALALSWIASLAMRADLRDEIVAHTPVYFAITVLLGAWYTASTVWADTPSEATYQLIRLGPNLLLVPIIVSAVNDARTLRWLIGSLLAGVLFSTLYGIVVAPSDPAAEGRLTGYGLDPNALALWAIMAAALAYGIVAARIEPAVRALVVFGMLMCGVAVLASGSRAGLLDLGVSLLLAPSLLRRGHRAVAIVSMVAALAGAVTYLTSFAPREVTERILVDPGDTSGRSSIWTVGIRMVEANPVGGVGGGNFASSSVHYLLEPGQVKEEKYIVDIPKAAHNTYLQVVAEVGFVGGALFFSLLGLSAGYTVRAVRRFTAAGLRDLEVLARGVLLAYAGVLVCILSISVDNAKPMWLLLSLGPVLAKLVRREGLSAATAGTRR